MIHPDDTLEYAPESTRWVVTRVGRDDIQVQHATTGVDWRYPKIDAHTLELRDSDDWRLIQCPHAAPKPQAPPLHDSLISRLSYNCAAMEVTLENIWRVISRLNNQLES